VPAVCGRDVTMARLPKPAKTEPVVTSKCTSGRPLLIDSAPQTEFAATYSKQTTKKFLTGARTHIRIFNFSPFTTQNPAQLIHRLHALIRRKRVHTKYSNRVNSLHSRRFTRASLRFHALPAPKIVPSAELLPGSAQNIENDVTSTKQTTEDFLPGATTTCSLSRDSAAFTIENLSRNVQVLRRRPFLMPGRAPLTLFAGWANMARTS